MRIAPGNDKETMFLEDLPVHFEGLQADIITQLDMAAEEFEQDYPTFYGDLRDELSLNGEIDFISAILYLDTYYSSRHNGLGSKVLNQETEFAAQQYFKYYYDRGLFGDAEMNRVFTHTYFASMLHDFYTKLQNYQDRAYTDKKISITKASLYFGEHKTVQTILKVLGEDYDYFPLYVDTIEFELYDRDTQPYVHASHNGKPMSLEGHADENGDMMFNIFMDYICDKLYYGDIDAVKKGNENFRDVEF